MVKVTKMIKNLIAKFFTKKAKVVTIDEALQLGNVKITAIKKDGTISEKIATKRKETMVWFGIEPKGVKKECLTTITFIDVEAGSWKSFVRKNILECEFLGNEKIIIKF
jgi:hypothetical protein